MYSVEQAVGLLGNLQDGICPPTPQELEKLNQQLVNNNSFADKVAEEIGTTREFIISDLFDILTSA